MLRKAWALAAVAGIALPHAAPAAVFSGVAAGDMSANDAILWTRTADGTGAAVADPVTVQLSTDPGFGSV